MNICKWEYEDGAHDMDYYATECLFSWHEMPEDNECPHCGKKIELESTERE